MNNVGFHRTGPIQTDKDDNNIKIISVRSGSRNYTIRYKTNLQEEDITAHAVFKQRVKELIVLHEAVSKVEGDSKVSIHQKSGELPRIFINKTMDRTNEPTSYNAETLKNAYETKLQQESSSPDRIKNLSNAIEILNQTIVKIKTLVSSTPPLNIMNNLRDGEIELSRVPTPQRTLATTPRPTTIKPLPTPKKSEVTSISTPPKIKKPLPDSLSKSKAESTAEFNDLELVLEENEDEKAEKDVISTPQSPQEKPSKSTIPKPPKPPPLKLTTPKSASPQPVSIPKPPPSPLDAPPPPLDAPPPPDYVAPPPPDAPPPPADDVGAPLSPADITKLTLKLDELITSEELFQNQMDAFGYLLRNVNENQLHDTEKVDPIRSTYLKKLEMNRISLRTFLFELNEIKKTSGPIQQKINQLSSLYQTNKFQAYRQSMITMHSLYFEFVEHEKILNEKKDKKNKTFNELVKDLPAETQTHFAKAYKNSLIEKRSKITDMSQGLVEEDFSIKKFMDSFQQGPIFFTQRGPRLSTFQTDINKIMDPVKENASLSKASEIIKDLNFAMDEKQAESDFDKVYSEIKSKKNKMTSKQLFDLIQSYKSINKDLKIIDKNELLKWANEIHKKNIKRLKNPNLEQPAINSINKQQIVFLNFINEAT